MTRLHRTQIAYPALWKAIEGQIRSAMNAHPDIQIPEKRIASIVKRAAGEVLALEVRPGGEPGESLERGVDARSGKAGELTGPSKGGGQCLTFPHTKRKPRKIKAPQLGAKT